MLLVLPVSHMDLDRALRLVKRINKYGGMEADMVLLSATWRAAWDVSPILQILSETFGNVLFNKLDTECEVGWPDAANHLFYETAKHVHALGMNLPWYFMEADNTPLRPCWFADLKKEYVLSSKPYMGVVNKSRWVNQQTGEQFIRGEHMVGTGIYPPGFLMSCKSVHLLDIIPWDVAIGPEILPEVHNTKLISHHWGCQNARREADGLIWCDTIDPKKEYNAGVISAEAVVCHGVKDGSLDRVLDEGEPATTMTAS